MSILSIQSQVVAGHVGNSTAVFALQRCGREVWSIPTTLLSHHPGHGGAQGGPLPAEFMQKLLDGMAARHCFETCEAVISGYLGSAAAAAIVRQAVTRARAGSQQCVFLCDPVLGDDGRAYVSHEVVTEMHNLAAFADILTPNEFELRLLSGQAPADRAAALSAMRSLQARGPKLVLVTSFAGADTAPGMIDLLAIDGPAAWRVSLPRLAPKFSGAGDLLAALFLHAWLPERNTAAALRQSCAGVYAVLAQTARTGADELALIPAQHQMLNPSEFFTPEPMA